jgi:hypothetical protein
MLDVTNFLTRWLYMCNLVRDVADIQTLPYAPLQHHHHHHDVPLHPPPSPHVPHASTAQSTGPVSAARTLAEQEWNDQCLRGIMTYPPGTQRLYAMDAIRLELVQKLAQHVKKSDNTLHRLAVSCKRQREIGEQVEDPYLDADVEIIRAFEEATTIPEDDAQETASLKDDQQPEVHKEGSLVISEDGTNLMQSDDEQNIDMPLLEEEIPDPEQVNDAYGTTMDLKDYLPQLVSAVLKSPPAFQPQLLDPIRKLRRLLLTRCLLDANWGIELCWLLEADVGRAWKTLFEHRQQTGKRLIVVLPAEKAVVLAKIGMEKREAFDLLQDAEQATAYGYTFPHVYDTIHHATPRSFDDDDSDPTPPKLPSSLSLRRCSHFGDTMHFIDRLTQISLDLRMVPIIQRHEYLQQRLSEINRRLRRRMVTRGDVSLDVEDNRGPNDWPQLSDVSADVLKYSVHFPLEPKVRIVFCPARILNNIMHHVILIVSSCLVSA